MKSILARLQALERLKPSLVTVTYSNRKQTVVEPLEAFNLAANIKGVTFTVPENKPMENLLRAVADAMADE